MHRNLPYDILITSFGRTTNTRVTIIHTRTYPNFLNQLTVKCIMVEQKRRGMTAVVSALPINALSPQQFVFKVIDQAQATAK